MKLYSFLLLIILIFGSCKKSPKYNLQQVISHTAGTYNGIWSCIQYPIDSVFAPVNISATILGSSNGIVIDSSIQLVFTGDLNRQFYSFEYLNSYGNVVDSAFIDSTFHNFTYYSMGSLFGGLSQSHIDCTFTGTK